MSITLILSYVFGAVGVLISYVIYRQTNRKNLLGAKLASDIVWSIHYLLIAAYSGAVTCGISTLREIIFMNKEHKWAKSKLWLVGFIACNIVSIFFMWKGIVSIVPACSAVTSTVLYWIGNPDLTRRVQLPISCAFFIYNLSSGSYFGVANEVLSLISIFTSRKKSSEQ